MKYRVVKYLLLCILFISYLFIDIYWVGAIPCFFFLFIQMLTQKQQVAEYSIGSKLEKDSDKPSIGILLFGSLFGSVVLLNPIGFYLKKIYQDYLSDSNGVSRFLSDFPLLASPIFWIVLPLAFLVGGGTAVVITAFAKGKDKIIQKFIFWMNTFEIPMIVLQLYTLWKYYQSVNSWITTIEDNLLSILAFALAIILCIYNAYKKKFIGQTSLSYFMLRSFQFYFFVVSVISSLYFLLVFHIET